MKKVIRSLAWTDQAEKDSAGVNFKHARPDRLSNLRTTERAIVDYLTNFYQQHAEAPQFNSLVDHFETAQDAEAIVLLEEVRVETPYHGASFVDLFEKEVEEQAAQALVDICKTATKIATQGAKIGHDTVKGTNEAVAYLFSSAKGKPADAEGRMPTSMKKASDAISKVYQERKANPSKSYGVLTGYGLIDSATAGIGKKQFYLHAGYGGHLKSTHMMNMILNAAVDGGWNPLLFTSEMPQADVNLMFIAMHSANPKFAAIGRPLHYFRLRLGALRQDEEDFFETVKDDLLNNPNHGTIRVVDAGEFTTFGSVIQRTIREHAEEEVDILWMDYLTRFPLDLKYQKVDHKTGVNLTLADAKRFAMSFDKGTGLAVCSPFQINREGYKKAKANEGRMDATVLADYNAAEKEADSISYIFYDVDEQATSEPKIGLIKTRWGAKKADPVSVFIEPDSRRIVDLSAGMSVATGYAPTRAASGEEEVVM